MDLVAGITFGVGLFVSYGAFNIFYSMIYLSGSGTAAALMNSEGSRSPPFHHSVTLYLWVWFILSIAYPVATIRCSWDLSLDLWYLTSSSFILQLGTWFRTLMFSKLITPLDT